MKDIDHIRDLKPDQMNARRRTERNLQMIEASLNEVGAARSIVVDEDGNILAGNGTVEAAALAGIEKVQIVDADGETLIAVRRRGLTAEQKRRLALYDNRSAELAEWDAAVLACLESEEPGVTKGMWTEDELLYLLENVDLTDAEEQAEDAGAQVDKAEELREKWGVESGQLWRCGEHRVICGDCREPETWRRLLDAAGVEKVNGVFTSPPYAMQRKEQYGGVPVAEYVEWWDSVQAQARANLAGDGSFFVNIKPHCEDGQRVLYVFDLVLAMVRRWGWRFVDELCWKHQGVPGRWEGRLKNQFEPVYHFITDKITIRHKNIVSEFASNSEMLSVYDGIDNRPAKTGSPFRQGGKKSAEFDGALPGNVLSIPIGNVNNHAAAFPVSLPDFFIRAYSDNGDVWLDPFCGSGTTIMAAHKNERRGLGIEMLPKYVAVTLQRYADTTGDTPELIS